MRIYHGVADKICMPRNISLLQKALERAEAEHLEVQWVQLPHGQEHHADWPAYQDSDDLFQWLLQHQREEAIGIRMPSKFYVCGSWSDWRLEEMSLESDDTYTSIIGVDAYRRAQFLVIRDADWNQRYCPQPVAKGERQPPAGVATCLIDDQERPAIPGAAQRANNTQNCHWLIDAARGHGSEDKLCGANAKFKIRFNPETPSLQWEPFFDLDEWAAISRLIQLGAQRALAADVFIQMGRREGLAARALQSQL